MPIQYFIRKASEYIATNKLQKAILSILPSYYNRLLYDPTEFFIRLENRILFFNRQYPRCKPMKITRTPIGKYMRAAGAQEKLNDDEQGTKNGWRFTIDGLAEMEIMAVKGTLEFDKSVPTEFTYNGSGSVHKLNPVQSTQLSILD